MQITFYGAAGEVTGSNYLLESGGVKLLIDCGLAQGGRFAEEKNFEPFPYDPSEIQAVLVTHAHIDHVGRIPMLTKGGFRGTIYSTPPTRDFAELLLLDSEHLLLRVAEELGKEPLYAAEDIEIAMSRWEGRKYHEKFHEGPFEVEFFDAGHILGSSTIKVSAEGKSIVFSGDLGNYPAPIIKDTEALPECDYLVMESTYGGRVHEGKDRREVELEQAITETVRRGGTVLIPAFAMERTQDLLYHLNDLVEKGKIPKVPIFLDSPLAIKLTTVYDKYKNYFDAEATAEIKEGDDLFEFPGLEMSLTTEESKAINNVAPPKVIIAGSGMSNGGRILHHERRYLPDPKSCLLIVGYQARGTLGRRLLEGADHVRMFGEDVPVRCEIRNISAFSAHADQPRLLAWVAPRAKTLTHIYLTHGEEEQAGLLALKIKEEFGLAAKIPPLGTAIELGGSGAAA